MHFMNVSFGLFALSAALITTSMTMRGMRVFGSRYVYTIQGFLIAIGVGATVGLVGALLMWLQV